MTARAQADKTQTAKLFMSGRSQAVRLPKEFRFQGKEVRVRRVGDGVLLEPMKRDWEKFFQEIDRLIGGKFMEDGRQQPPMPPERKIFD